jgi:methionyl-tRNA formyltransferase
MKIAIIGQQDFGKAVLDAFLARGDTVAAVFCAPEKDGARPDVLRVAAEQQRIPVYQFKSLRAPEATQAMRDADADIGIMAFVLQFAPQEFVKIPKHGTIQYHPSLLPKFRGPSSINWPIIKGETTTGLTIFRPSDGLDEGAIVLQKQTPISPDDTLGSVYFDRLFPMGVDAMLEGVDLVKAGKAPRTKQDESKATYEGRCTPENAKIDWGKPWEQIDRLIRGCNPAPGAWTIFDGKQLRIFDAKPMPAKDPKGIGGKLGEIVAVEADGFTVVCADGRFKITRVQPADGKKIDAGEWAKSANIAAKARFT